MTYNLDEKLEDEREEFDFTLDGHTYWMRYPTTEETAKFEELADKGKGTEVLDIVYGYIRGAEKDTPPIKKVLGKKSIKFLQKRFMPMIRAEFGGE